MRDKREGGRRITRFYAPTDQLYTLLGTLMRLFDKVKVFLGAKKQIKEQEDEFDIDDDWLDVLQECVVRLDSLEKSVAKLYKRQSPGRPPNNDVANTDTGVVMIGGKDYKVYQSKR